MEAIKAIFLEINEWCVVPPRHAQKYTKKSNQESYVLAIDEFEDIMMESSSEDEDESEQNEKKREEEEAINEKCMLLGERMMMEC